LEISENDCKESWQSGALFTDQVGDSFLFVGVDNSVAILIRSLDRLNCLVDNERVVVIDEVGFFTFVEPKLWARHSSELFGGEESVAVLVGRLQRVFTLLRRLFGKFGEVESSVVGTGRRHKATLGTLRAISSFGSLSESNLSGSERNR
jgi:hypothetical protein